MPIQNALTKPQSRRVFGDFWPFASILVVVAAVVAASPVIGQETFYPQTQRGGVPFGGSVMPGEDDSLGSLTSPPIATAPSRMIGRSVDAVPRPGQSLSVPEEIKDLLQYGGVPKDLDQLRLLEKQFQRVSALTETCTVSVQIGPAQGCGVIITASGYVLTAAHVAMRPGKNANLTLSDGRIVKATTLGLNRNFDAGLLKINGGQGSNWPHTALGSSDGLIPGMWCVAMGHPGGYEPARGMVTRVGRILEARPGSILTDCTLIGGDSGGPLFDLSGELIAVHSRIGNDVAENLHVPIDCYDDHWADMANGKAWGYLPGFRPVLGVRGRESDVTATVDSVRSGSPAEEAGIEPGDVIEQFGDSKIGDFLALKKAVSDTMPGERIDVWLRRDGVARRIRLEIGRADD